MTPEEQLERARWHILRGDSLRAGVASRAGTLLSTNALVVAGIALALGLRNHGPGLAAKLLAGCTLACVGVSAVNASLATMTIRSWRRQFPDHQDHGGSEFSFIEISSGATTFEEFKKRAAERTVEDVLEDALAEQWQNNVLHRYRYLKLRTGLRWLLLALGLLLITTVASAFS